jgi:hypothetical protein
MFGVLPYGIQIANAAQRIQLLVGSDQRVSSQDIPVGSWLFSSDPIASRSPAAVCINRQDTTLRGRSSAGETTLEVESTANMSAGDTVAIELARDKFWDTTVRGVTDGQHLTITDQIPPGLIPPSGARVRTNRWKAIAAIGQ